MLSALSFRASVLRSARMLSDEINRILLPYQLNYSLWQVLFVISDQAGCTSIEIAHYLNVSKPCIAKRIQVLHDMQLLQQIDTTDKRQKKVLLSTKGLMLFRECAEQIHQYEQQLISTINPEQIQTCMQVLQQVIHKLEPKSGVNSHD